MRNQTVIKHRGVEPMERLILQRDTDRDTLEQGLGAGASEGTYWNVSIMSMSPLPWESPALEA